MTGRQDDRGRRHRHHRVRLRSEDRAVTPVVGTILILLISVLGVGAIMAWGGPTVQKIQDRNALTAMVQEFEDIRTKSVGLTVAENAALPTIVLTNGDLSIQNGSRIMVTINVTDGTQGCNFHVYGWNDATPATISYDAPGPSSSACGKDPDGAGNNYKDFDFEVWQVTGASVTRVVHNQNITAGTGITCGSNCSALDFSQGDWLFQITNVHGDSRTFVYAEAWLFTTEQIRWSLQTSQKDMAVMTEGGAIFSYLDGTYFLERFPRIQEDAFGNDDTVARLFSYKPSANLASASGHGQYSIALSLEGNHLRNSTTAAGQVRFDFAGELAEAWCNSLINRNADINENRYSEDPSFTCASGNIESIRSVTYRPPGTATFPFEFIHAIIKSTLAVQ